MADEVQAPDTLRDTLEASFDASALAEGIESTPASVEAQPTEAPTETAEARAERLRDDKGRFAPKAETPAEPKATPQAQNAPAKPDAAVTQPMPTVKSAPSSWTKEQAAKFAQLPQDTQDYILLREQQFTNGVSTYKAEADRARELNAAIEPFIPNLQRFGIQPTQWIRNLGAAHEVLALGTPEQKLQKFGELAQMYGVPLQMLQTGQDGQQPQIDPFVSQLLQKVQNLEGNWNQLQQTQQQRERAELDSHIQRFAADVEKHPHYEQVKAKMGQLLGAGLAEDLESAYQQAIRLDENVWQAEQSRQSQIQEATARQAKADVVARARAKAVSPASSTPSGHGTRAAEGLRATLESGFDSVMASRV